MKKVVDVTIKVTCLETDAVDVIDSFKDVFRNSDISMANLEDSVSNKRYMPKDLKEVFENDF
jgi:hypothetical protein